MNHDSRNSAGEAKISFRFLKREWRKPYVTRQEIAIFTEGLLNANQMNNLDCGGKGPAGRFKIGKAVAYPVDGLISWLESRTRI